MASRRRSAGAWIKMATARHTPTSSNRHAPTSMHRQARTEDRRGRTDKTTSGKATTAARAQARRQQGYFCPKDMLFVRFGR
eukprot:5980383-Heterocapsa_arctica.AAC.1